MPWVQDSQMELGISFSEEPVPPPPEKKFPLWLIILVAGTITATQI